MKMRKQKLFIVTLLMTFMTLLFSGCTVKMSVPKVKEARFDFSITYEVQGEEKTYTSKVFQRK